MKHKLVEKKENNSNSILKVHRELHVMVAYELAKKRPFTDGIFIRNAYLKLINFNFFDENELNISSQIKEISLPGPTICDELRN